MYMVFEMNTEIGKRVSELGETECKKTMSNLMTTRGPENFSKLNY